MLAIKFIGSPRFIQWHVNEPSPVIFERINEIELIQADGHELTHIIGQYNTPEGMTIPYAPNVRVMRWCGSIAQTIIANLCS